MDWRDPLLLCQGHLLQLKKNIDPNRQEAAALGLGVKKFNHYVYDQPFKSYTDHKYTRMAEISSATIQ